jgi:hypothetical protein
MIADPICRLSPVRPTQTTQASSLLDPDFREQGEKLLRDLAFVLHLTGKVKRQLLAEGPVLAGAGLACR